MTTPTVHFTEAVLHGIAGRARDAVPNETGGVLVGWREDMSVSVMDFIELPSGRPNRARYELSAANLNRALADYLAQATDPRMGYVGSWHSHPSMVGPSPLDKYTFLKTARANAGPIAFMVAATDGRATVFHLTWAGQRSGLYRLVRQQPITRKGA